jgi:hypothetical protein
MSTNEQETLPGLDEAGSGEGAVEDLVLDEAETE